MGNDKGMGSSRNDLPHERPARSGRRRRDEPKDRGRPGDVTLKDLGRYQEYPIDGIDNR